MVDKRLIAKLAREGGGKLLDHAIGKLLAEGKARSATKPKSTLAGKAASAAMAQVARRSVPAAILIGGAVLAKHLYDRRRTRAPGTDDDQA